MLRFLKWIFLVFGGLGLAILFFFFIQNKHDLETAWDSHSSLSYSGLKQTCLNIEKDYYFPCFKKSFSKYLDKVSMTGMSLGLKMAFNFIDEDRKYTKYFKTDLEKDLTYSLNYLVLSNMALDQSYKRFFGLKFTYGGFVGKVKDNLEKATAFSEGIIKGLKGDDGITKLNNPILEDQMYAKLTVIEKDLEQSKRNVHAWLNIEVARLEKKYK